jgi:hypothetical protein
MARAFESRHFLDIGIRVPGTRKIINIDSKDEAKHGNIANDNNSGSYGSNGVGINGGVNDVKKKEIKGLDDDFDIPMVRVHLMMHQYHYHYAFIIKYHHLMMTAMIAIVMVVMVVMVGMGIIMVV